MARIDFGGVKETVVTRKEFPLSRAHKVLKKEVIAVIGYGVQGPAQALNMKDNGFKRNTPFPLKLRVFLTIPGETFHCTPYTPLCA